jgi:hypothetical protein
MADAFEQFHGYAPPSWTRRPDRYTTWGGSGQVTVQPASTVQLTFQSNLFHWQQRRSSLEQALPALFSTTDSTFANFVNGTVTAASLNAYERATDEQLTFNSAMHASWAPWVWLPLTGTVGLNISTGHDVTLLPRNFVPYISQNCINQCDSVGRYGTAQKNATQKTLTINTTIPGWNGRLNTAFGVNVYTQSSHDITAQTDTLGVANGVSTPSDLLGRTSQNSSGTSTFGWYFEPRLMLSQRFFLTPGFRLDGGTANGGRASVSGLPRNLTFAALFPKVNLSWIAIERQGDERPLFGALTLLRPRLALGSAGVQPNPGDQLRLLSVPNQLPNDLILQTLGNTRLRPERSSEIESGFEAVLWHGRVSMDVTYARQLRHDAIINVPVAASVIGGATIALNVAEVRNTSTEVSLALNAIETNAVSWTVGGSMSHNNNIVLKLDQNSIAQVFGATGQAGGTPNSVTITDTKIAVGYPLFGRWAKPILGYADVDGNGILEANELRLGDTAVYLGRNDPTYTATFTTDLTLLHGRLGVHANFSRQGGYTQLADGAGLGPLTVANEQHATLGQQANYIASLNGSPIGLIQTVNVWRFQSFSVNYVVPRTLAQRFHATNMSVALQGSNLALWTNYRGKDPSVNAFPNGNAIADGGQLPTPSTWRLQFTLGN